jgi:hypothetical protein
VRAVVSLYTDLRALCSVFFFVSGRTNPPNWQVAHTNMLIWAVGSVPFKDDFWSGGGVGVVQPNCPYITETGCSEPNPELEAIISAVTAGPIGPSDTIGYANASIIGWTCRQDGLLLKPDRPATYLDATFSLSFETLAVRTSTRRLLSSPPHSPAPLCSSPV